MKTFRTLITGFFLAFIAAGLAPSLLRAQDAPPPQDDSTSGDTGTADNTGTDDTSAPPSFDYFYDALQPYGQWIQVEGYGYCWQPTAAQDPNWQPYTDGYWAYTDAGWTWVSYEDFGWITYHYGRWTQIQDAGWIWVPDYQWAPAWVSWRVSRNFNAPPDASFIGWAPLPPECQFNADTGIGFWVDARYDIGPGFYNFCRVRDFGTPVLGPVIIDRSKNIFIINSTANITNITTNNNIVYNGGPSYLALSSRIDPAHPIPTLQLVRQTDPRIFRRNGAKGMLAQSRGKQLIIAAPMIVAPKQPFKPAKVAKVFDKPVVTKGWAGVDPKQKLQLQAAIKTQNKGLKLAPAKAVTAQQLAVIPKGATPVPPGQPTPTPHGKNLKPAFTPGKPTPAPGQPTATPPAKKVRPTPALTPFNPNASKTPFVPKEIKETPPPKPTQQPNAAAIEQEKAAAAEAAAAKQQQATEAARQQQLEQQKAAEEAAAARREQLQQQAAQQQRPTPPPGPAGPPAGFPPRGGKPTPTPTPH